MSKNNTITEKKYLDLNGLTMFLSKLEEKFVSIQNTNTYLKYVSQTLTNDQKLQVATNIGNNTMLPGHLIKYNENGTITSNGFINENLLYVLPNSTLSESENVDIFATKNSLKTINGESILGSGDISTDNSYFLDFDISDIANLLKTDEAFEYDGASLVEAIRNNKNIYIYYDKTTRSKGMALVNCHYEDYMDMTFCYDGELYSIQAEGINFITKREVVVKTIHSIPTMDDIFDEGLDGDYVKANGIVDENDYYYHVPSDTATNPDFTLATKSDINASLTKPANYQIWYTTTDDSVIEFDDTLFDNNQLLSNVYENGKGVITFDRDILSIPASVFSRKNNLKTIIIPDSVTTIGNTAFGQSTSLTSVTIGDSVTTIGESAFASCTSLTNVTIPDSVTTIEIQVFWNCNSLISVTIGDSVTTIGARAFRNCESLTSIIIPDGVTSIGDRAFYDCDSLTSVYCNATTPPGIFEDTEPFDTDTNLKIYVPIESLNTYKTVEGWDVYSDKICSLLDSNSVKTINGESIIGSGDITISGGTSDANVQAVDTGDVIDDVNVEYATTAYVDGLIGDINSVLENIING